VHALGHPPPEYFENFQRISGEQSSNGSSKPSTEVAGTNRGLKKHSTGAANGLGIGS
jgi:hypothetical protein